MRCCGDESGEDIGWRMCVLSTFPYGRGRQEMRDCSIFIVVQMTEREIILGVLLAVTIVMI